MFNWLQKLLGRSDIWVNGVLYMKRWKFMPEHLPGFRLHNIIKSDSDRELHDHPFTFVTFILKGGYTEYLADGSKTWHGAPAVLYRPGKTLHRLELPLDANGKEIPAWTFVLRSKHWREWGFQTEQGWVHWKDFVSTKPTAPETLATSEFACKSST
jgi:hypothetical protein